MKKIIKRIAALALAALLIVSVFAGDFCECFKTETGKPALDALIKKHDEIYAVLGNCDEPDFIEELEDAEINAERILNFTEGLSIIGSGGGQIFTKQTPNERTEEDLIDDFKILNCENASSLENLIVISHKPENSKSDLLT